MWIGTAKCFEDSIPLSTDTVIHHVHNTTLFLTVSTFDQHSFNKSLTDVDQMLKTKTERSVQTASTPFNIFENKGNVVQIKV